jgi:toxin-antitoxin system PIN domain toxin
MRSLLDVNVLIALLDADHVSNAQATHWFAEHAREGWASCPITQNGCIRIMSSPAYPNAQPPSAVIRRLAAATAAVVHEFWADDFSLVDGNVADPERILGPRQLTDVYLLGLAVRRGGRLVTFDTAIPLNVIRGATGKHLLVL